MAKIDDTNEIPQTLTAPWVKRFFKNKIGVAVRVENANSQKWMSIWLIPSDTTGRDLKYDNLFSSEFGQRCMGIVYKENATLSQQAWGGNIRNNGIAMYGREFRELLRSILDNPFNAPLVKVNPQS